MRFLGGLLLLCAGFSLAQSLQGVMDAHAHETIPRSVDAITLARLAQVEGMRAVVFKNHFFPTTGIAFLVHRIVPGLPAITALRWRSRRGVAREGQHRHQASELNVADVRS